MNEVATMNPYWDEVEDLIVLKAIAWHDHLFSSRRSYCRKYAWAVSDPTSLVRVAHHLGGHGGRGIEIGAGLGYWAWQLSQLGIDILAYDTAPPDQEGNDFCGPLDPQGYPVKERVATWYPVQRGGPDVLAEHANRTLFLCWPPYDEDMAHRCLQCYQGNRFVFIGEGPGGCTGSDAFFERLEQEWEEVAAHRIPQWFGINDYIAVYERRIDENEQR